jgi:hypothetical protein
MSSMHRLLPSALSAPARLSQGLSRRHDAVQPLLDAQRRVEAQGFTYDQYFEHIEPEPEKHEDGTQFMEEYNTFMAQIGWTDDRFLSLADNDDFLYRIDIQLCELRCQYWEDYLDHHSSNVFEEMVGDRDMRWEIERIVANDIHPALVDLLRKIDISFRQEEDEGEIVYETYGDEIDIWEHAIPAVEENFTTNWCIICTEGYGGDHPAMGLLCGHILGLECLEYLLNDSAEANSTLCPYCRAVICKGRARRPTEGISPRARVRYWHLFLEVVRHFTDACILYKVRYGVGWALGHARLAVMRVNEELSTKHLPWQLRVEEKAGVQAQQDELPFRIQIDLAYM